MTNEEKFEANGRKYVVRWRETGSHIEVKLLEGDRSIATFNATRDTASDFGHHSGESILKTLIGLAKEQAKLP